MDLEALYSEAMADIDAGRHDEAQRLLAEVLVADPKHARAWMALGLIVPEMQRAIECLQRSLALNPNNTEAQKYLALAEDMRRRDEAPEPPVPSPPHFEVEDSVEADAVAAEEPTGGLPGLGNLLLESGALTHRELEQALEMQHKMADSGKSQRLGELLVARRFITREQLEQAVREQRARLNNLFTD